MSIPNCDELKNFFELCKAEPRILCKPELASIKALIEHFGGKVDYSEPENETESKFEEAKSKPQVENEESDLELDMTEVIEPDTDEPQEMGDSALQPTEEEIAESHSKRAEAVSAFNNKDFKNAIKLYTEAIKLNPQAALLYAKRGQVYLLLKKPNACIRDCNRALELNSDSAAGHKFRGRAYYVLGKWEEAVNDLRLACKFDFDEQADKWLREATPNAHKIEERKRKKERKLEENVKEQTDDENVKKAKEKPEIDVSQFLDDRESFLDPEICAVFKEMDKNPSSWLNFGKNPTTAAFLEKLGKVMSKKTGGLVDIAGFSDRNASQFNNPKSSQQPQDDIALD